MQPIGWQSVDVFPKNDDALMIAPQLVEAEFSADKGEAIRVVETDVGWIPGVVPVIEVVQLNI